MDQLHIFLLPLTAYGHMIPALDMAKLFLSRGVKTTIITTPECAKEVENLRQQGFEIGIECVKFPEVGFRGGDDDAFSYQFAIYALQEPVEELMERFRPDCLVADMFFPWASDAAAKFNIPRLAFHGTSCFAVSVSENMRLYRPFEKVSTDFEPFVVPDLPHPITFSRTQVSANDRGEIKSDFDKVLEEGIESVKRSYGVIFNSFYELEPEYLDRYKEVSGRKAWHVGPLFLCNYNKIDKAHRGKTASIDEQECLKWLDSKNPNSVIYLCFGSIAEFSDSQLHEIASALETSGQEFIWVVKKSFPADEKWLPEGFKERTKGKGLIINGWAPQLLILSHAAVGAFVTHCGWNSTLEAVAAGVPMVTWPLFAEQFYNEKLVTDVLKVGIPVGNQKWSVEVHDGVKREEISKALERIMSNVESLEIRKRGGELGEIARKAVEPGGSSDSDLSCLLQELCAYHQSFCTK